MMDVLFVTAGDRTRASSRLRVYELIPYLEQVGISAETITAPDSKGNFSKIYKKSVFASQVLSGAIKNDIVYVQKVRLPIWFTNLLSSISPTLIYDFDDAIYRAPPGEDIDKQAVQQLNVAIEQSDLTIAGSHELVEYAQQYTDDVECLHTGIPREEYTEHRNLDTQNSEAILLGWIGNPENLYYLDDIEEQIDRILEEFDNVQLRIITGKETPVRPLKHREGKNVEYIEWNLESALADLAEVDVGVRPLRDNEWTRAKGGFTSVIECLALGIPVVASPVGLIKYLIEDGKNGYLADEPDEWVEVLSTMATEPERITQLRQESIETVSKYEFWSENVADSLIKILYEIVE
jgi:glycosyltransferase involved in cell wall biosynthesis